MEMRQQLVQVATHGGLWVIKGKPAVSGEEFHTGGSGCALVARRIANQQHAICA